MVNARGNRRRSRPAGHRCSRLDERGAVTSRGAMKPLSTGETGVKCPAWNSLGQGGPTELPRQDSNLRPVDTKQARPRARARKKSEIGEQEIQRKRPKRTRIAPAQPSPNRTARNEARRVNSTAPRQTAYNFHSPLTMGVFVTREAAEERRTLRAEPRPGPGSPDSASDSRAYGQFHGGISSRPGARYDRMHEHTRTIPGG